MPPSVKHNKEPLKQVSLFLWRLIPKQMKESRDCILQCKRQKKMPFYEDGGIYNDGVEH
jgi:hypothetical protein